MKIKASELKLADTIRMFDGPWNCAIVRQIKEGQVFLFRPYGETADFSYVGGVIPYIGIEEYSIPADERMIEVMNRKELI